MTFATKKEADEYDKMLDIADNVYEFLEDSKVKLDETQLESISLLLAENREKFMQILRGGTLKKEVTRPESSASPAPKKSKAKKEQSEPSLL